MLFDGIPLGDIQRYGLRLPPKRGIFWHHLASWVVVMYNLGCHFSQRLGFLVTALIHGGSTKNCTTLRCLFFLKMLAQPNNIKQPHKRPQTTRKPTTLQRNCRNGQEKKCSGQTRDGEHVREAWRLQKPKF